MTRDKLRKLLSFLITRLLNAHDDEFLSYLWVAYVPGDVLNVSTSNVSSL